MPDKLAYELIVPAQADNLALIGDFVAAVSRRAGLEDKEVFEVQLAVDEACTNVIEHAYHGRAGSIHLVCSFDERALEIQVHDTGDRFDPSLVPVPDLEARLEDREMGGLGLHFMRSVMDHVDFRFNDLGNHLTMVKRKAS